MEDMPFYFNQRLEYWVNGRIEYGYFRGVEKSDNTYVLMTFCDTDIMYRVLPEFIIE